MDQDSDSLWLLSWDLSPGGAEQQLVRLVRARAAWDRHLAVVLFAPQGDLLHQVRSGVPLLALSEQRPVSVPRQVIWLGTTALRFASLVRKHRPAAIVSFLPVPTLVASLALRSMRDRPPLIWSMQSDVHRHYGERRKGILSLLRRFTVPMVDLFIAPSQGVRRQIVAAFSAPDWRVTVIPNAIDGTKILQGIGLSSSCMPSKGARHRIVTVGRCAAVKGYDCLLAAMAELRQRDVELCVLGEGPLRPSLERKAAELKLSDQVRFVGYMANPYAWLSTADSYVSASRWETFGIAIAEAMACGLPVVATATDGARDLIRSMQTGILVPIDQPDRLVDAIRTLLDDGTLCRELGSAAAANVRAFDAPNVARRYCEAIGSLL
jgi:glycosyltransferase involved in cell wall biosynthesis